MKAPFKILYSNDLTHIGTCVSPYHRRDEKFTRAMLDASVDETANIGIDVHMLQPGFGWVPLWQSKILSPSQHWTWLQKTYNAKIPDQYLAYLLSGGDIVGDFIQRCYEKSLVPFISLRMNDTHFLDKLHSSDVDGGQLNLCEFYCCHPEYVLESSSNSWRDRGQNWAMPEVREYKFNFIRELCENYDLKGLELDFMRYPALFRPYETTQTQREAVLAEFVKKVRDLLDETSRGKKRWLSLRLPVNYGMYDELGLNISRLEQAGVDMFNLSSIYFTAQGGDLSKIRSEVKTAATYVEMTHCASVGAAVDQADGDNFEFIKTSESQLYTTALSAYAQGIDGVSLFNFVYYREHGSEKKTTAVNEPPFGTIKHLRDREFASGRPQHYFLGSHWQDDGQLPKSIFIYGQHAEFTVENVLRRGAHNALLCVHIDNHDAGNWEAWFNERSIVKSCNPSCQWMTDGGNANLLAWSIPVEFLSEGKNQIEFRSMDAVKSIIDFIELIIW